ncbi:hypothetical protein [Celeribacter sp. PS-C1]|uniref:hypothetical protein n=1 Tax=Celeribacter sp. PS-C1 TaxID=2820813 RepID=UPI001CA5CD9D|nr:hypothetical protein [Celeribacter sp. PS-C1]MBW6419634.1 hypothetical protein [Celeribacter sp. PS-C1]
MNETDKNAKERAEGRVRESEDAIRDGADQSKGINVLGYELSETRIHPETGELLKRDVRKCTSTYKGHSIELDLPGWYPDGDGDSIHTGSDLEGWDAAMKELREME